MEAKNTFAVTMYIPYAKWRLNFERIFVTDFCSNNSAEILWYIYYINKSRYQNFQHIFLLDTILFKQQGLLKR